MANMGYPWSHVGGVAVVLAALVALAWAADPLCSTYNVAVNSYEIDGGIGSRFYFMGPNNKVVFFLSNRFVLHQSTDGGATWKPASAFPGTTGNPFLSSITVSADRRLLMVVGSGNTRNMIWTLQITDSGEPTGWALNAQTSFFNQIQPHPKHPQWVGALTETSACYNATEMDKCSQDFYFSIDWGKTWRLGMTYVSEFSWAYAGLDGNHDNQLFVVDWPEKSGNYRRKFADTKYVKRTTSFFSQVQTVTTNVVDFLAVEDDLFIVKRAVQGGLEMYTSVNSGDTWHRARFPHNKLENRYSILDTTEGSVFINIEHGEWNWGDVYTSDSYAEQFALSLTRNPRFPWGTTDFSRVYGLDGIYIGNQYVDSGEQNLEDVVTKMSWNKGGSWHRIPAPVEERHRCRVASECYLNLHGSTTNSRGRFYSRANALGVLLGTGNVGDTLRDSLSELNTYLSNDAGQTWTLFANGSYDYEISNHGGLMVLTPNLMSTNFIRFTSDEGKTAFKQCAFFEGTKKMEVTDIIAEPTGGQAQFIVYGRITGSSRGVVVHFDFSGVGERDCKGEKTPGAADSDYEYWTPRFGTQECQLGEKVSYVRRKPTVDCLNPTDFTSKSVQETCKCTREDYECDEAYFLEQDGTSCVKWDDEFDPKERPATCNDYWYETKGYRLVPGNKCNPTTGINLMPIKHLCPGYVPMAAGSPSNSNVAVPSGESSGYAFFLLVPFIAIIIAAFALFYAMTGRNQAVRSFATKCLPESILPTFRVPTESVAYSVLQQGGDDDLMSGEPDAQPVAENDAESDDFDPRK